MQGAWYTDTPVPTVALLPPEQLAAGAKYLGLPAQPTRADGH